MRTRSIVAAALMLAALAVAVPATVLSAPVGAADGTPTVVIDGRGWGHGRGMSQYGALGYASDLGWSSEQILDHYYGGTTAGLAPIPGEVDPRQVRVDLVYMRNRATTVALQSGTIRLRAADGSVLREETGAVRLTSSGGSMRLQVADDCDGPWSTKSSIDKSLVRIESSAGSDSQSGLLQVCGPSYRTWYEGEVWAAGTSKGQRTLNMVPINTYLRGVVPNEMPASWAAAALEVQAVAARSYALAGDHRWDGYADTCDSISCQVYDGRFTTRGSGMRTSTHPRTDVAIAATTDVVRLTPSGKVARTEFSSSSGGYTTGGDFPAVIDEGDSVALNRNHNWQVTVDLRSLERSYGLGSITGLSVPVRNGLGADNGRAMTVELRFTEGTATETADTIRRKFGLKSNWFRFGPLLRGGNPVSTGPADTGTSTTQPVEPGPDDPDDPDDPDGASSDRFVDSAFRQLLGRAPTTDEQQRWRIEALAGKRLELTQELAYSSHFAGVMVDELYASALGRSPDGDGRHYWVTTLADGLKYEHLGTLFYGSPEYVQRSGATNEAFVASLYVGILGRDPDEAGKGYWVEQLATGQAAPADVANSFYRSIESRRGRAKTLYQRVLERNPSEQEIAAGAENLLAMDDLRLAAELATALGAADETALGAADETALGADQSNN